MKRRNGRQTGIVVLIALGLAVALAVAGAVLRMNDRGIGFGEALAGFLRDTFNPAAGR